MPGDTFRDRATGITATAHDAAGARFLAEFSADIADHHRRKQEWEAALVAQGILIAHPDDGWVDRTANTIHFAYPTFQRTPPAVGVRVALGWPDRWRVVELTRHIPSAPIPGVDRWGFREVRDAD